MALGSKIAVRIARVGAARVGASRTGFVVARPVANSHDPDSDPHHWAPHKTDALPTTSSTVELKP